MGRVSADIMCTIVRRNACVPLQHVQCVSAWRATGTGATSRQARLIPRTLSSCAPTERLAQRCMRYLDRSATWQTRTMLLRTVKHTDGTCKELGGENPTKQELKRNMFRLPTSSQFTQRAL